MDHGPYEQRVPLGWIEPDLSRDLEPLVSWIDGDVAPAHHEVSRILTGFADELVRSYSSIVGLWR